MAALLTPEQQASYAYQLEHIREDRRPVTNAITVIFLALSTTAVALRFLSRKIINATYQADDWLVAVSLVFLYFTSTAALLDARYGYGLHLAAVKPENITKILKVNNSFQALYICAVTTVKLSILALYLRIFGSSRYRIVFYLVGLYVVAYWAAIFVINFTMCRPVSYLWNKNQSGTCVNLYALYLSISVLNLVGDVLVLASPWPIVWKLQASRTRKLIITGIFLLGSFVCVVTFVRIFFVKRLFTFDFTWSGYEAAILAVVEVHTGLICACLPTMRPIFHRADYRTKQSHSGGYSRSQESKISWPFSKRSNSIHPAGTESFDRLPGSLDEGQGSWDKRTGLSGKTSNRPRDSADPEVGISLSEIPPANHWPMEPPGSSVETQSVVGPT